MRRHEHAHTSDRNVKLFTNFVCREKDILIHKLSDDIGKISRIWWHAIADFHSTNSSSMLFNVVFSLTLRSDENGAANQPQLHHRVVFPLCSSNKAGRMTTTKK
ncbi:unnamed protein product [Orchesella dallaii]|uniref:Uncharacterized protein n=1 Tax=Orchesella dallaii TaxID=48710 RepID=A0ABP1RXI3_9HEXA